MWTPIGLIASATSASRAAIQPEDATENLAQIAQRSPAQITVDQNQSLAILLHVGSSVEITIQAAREDTRCRERRASLRVTKR